MIAAIYARKSTEQNGVGDEEKSVARQIEHGKAYAARKGWTVDEAHVYSDDGISGAEFKKRPGFLRLLNALSPRPPFQVLVMSEESRLGREAIETGYVLKQIMDAGVRVFFYLEDRERTLDTAMDKVMLSLTNFASEVEREKARQRTYDAMFRKAKALHVTGGKVYGYENVDVPSPEDNGTRLRVVRHINEEQAAIIRRVFELYASGVGMVKIAHRLNQEGVKPPRGRGWAPSGIREMLHRELYRGLVVWNGVRRSSGLEPKSSGRGISRSGSRRPGRPAATAMRQATGAVGFKAPLQPPHLAQAEPQGLSSLARGDPATTRGLYQSGTLQLLPAQREGLHGGRTFSRSSYPRTFSCSSSNSSASR